MTRSNKVCFNRPKEDYSQIPLPVVFFSGAAIECGGDASGRRRPIRPWPFKATSGEVFRYKDDIKTCLKPQTEHEKSLAPRVGERRPKFENKR